MRARVFLAVAAIAACAGIAASGCTADSGVAPVAPDALDALHTRDRRAEARVPERLIAGRVSDRSTIGIAGIQ